MTETSDAAYEKRHRKFENFEKRQRLREKEKLKHEHYKLKERIEQLRGMDGAAFLTLPASSFSPAPPGGDDNEETDTTLFPAMNGGIYHPEGERRRKEMLDIALKLEQRYTYLLPPERPRKLPEPSSSKEAESRDESDDEQDSGISFRKESVPKLRMQTAKSSASSSSAPSPAALKSAMPKSWMASLLEPRQPSNPVRNLRKNSIPANAVSAQPVLPSESLPEPLSPSPEIDVEGPENPPPPTYFLPPPPPPLPSASQFVWSIRKNMRTPTVNVSSLPFRQPQQLPGPTPMHWIPQDGNVSMEPNEMHFPEGRVGERSPVQDPPPADVHIDVESGKAPGPEDAPREVQFPPRKRRGRPPGGATPIVSATADKEGDPPIVVPQSVPKRRGRKPKASLLEIPQAEAELPEIRVMHTRLQGANIAESSKRVEEHENTQPNTILEGAPVVDEATESISTRPIKRRRRNMANESAAAARESSAQVSDRGAPISATATSVRGKTFVTYVDSRTGETVCTPSVLMIACVRATEKFNIRKARETTSFGVPTPEFGKGAIVDYELQEEILYRHLRDKSQTTGPESGVEPPAGEDGAQEQEERHVEGDEEVHEGDDAADQAEEEEVNIEPSEDEEFSIGPGGLGMHDEGDVEKEAAQPYPSKSLPPEIVGRFSYGPPIMLSPEPEPEPEPDALSPNLHIEAHPGVRPREPSRHIDDEDELLEW